MRSMSSSRVCLDPPLRRANDKLLERKALVFFRMLYSLVWEKPNGGMVRLGDHTTDRALRWPRQNR
jgi:hypothetical protein